MASNSMPYSNVTIPTCPESIDDYVRNLTSSYASRSNEFPVVAISVAMFLLAAGFLLLSLFSHVSDHVSSVLNPTVGLFLSGAVSLFLPVMSYLFSEAKRAEECKADVDGGSSELSPLARQILAWMLLVELLRKKVQAVKLVTQGTQRYIGIVTHAATVSWLGWLVFANLKEAGQVAVFGFLWIICTTKLVQRVVFAELMNRSLAYDKNARLVSSYMDRMLLRLGQRAGIDAAPAERMRTCSYVLMGEESLVSSEGLGPRGYLFDDLDRVTTDDEVVTVGKVWRLADFEHRPVLKSSPCFRRLCLSFALFKLLRRRIERLPAMTRKETDHCRDLIFQGLCRVDEADGGEVAVLEVLKHEIDFLSEYYHSVHPVVLASPFFFAVNYLVVPVVVCCLGATTTILSGSGDVPLALRGILVDNYAVSSGVFRLVGCLLTRARRTPEAFFPAMDVLISCLLFAAFLGEQLWELGLFLLSKWFMVSLLCTYTAKPGWRRSAVFRGAIRGISWARTKLGHPSAITLKQFSVLGATLPAASLPSEAARSIVRRFRLAAAHDGGAPLSNGCRALLEMPGRRHLSWFCESEDSVAKVILTWHIATNLLVKEHHPQRKQQVATRMSNYCAYLVAFHPELLPDDPEGTKRAYRNVKKDLRTAHGFWGYHFSSRRARCEKMLTMSPEKLRPDSRDDTMTVVQKGIVLGKALMEASKRNEAPVWELLNDVWVELVVYVAPSGSDEHVKGHEEALVLGGELVTLLWALATHAGITRPPPSVVNVEIVDDVICPA